MKKVALALLALIPLSWSAAQSTPVDRYSSTQAPARTTDNIDCEVNRVDYLRIVYGQDGHMFIASYDLMQDLPVDRYFPIIKAMSDNLKRQGVTLVVVPVAHKGIVDRAFLDTTDPLQQAYQPLAVRQQYQTLVNLLASVDVVVVNTLPTLERDAPAFWKTDWHWRPEVARDVAQVVARTVNRLPVVRNVPTVDYSTRVTGTVIMQDGGAFLADRIQSLCGVKLASRDTQNVYETVPTQEQGLLDPDVPQIVLAGTSYSKLSWNFEGFLKDALHKDVTNVSAVGGGPFGGLTAYLVSPEFQTNKPKVIIWEWDTSRFRDTPEDKDAFEQLLISTRANCATGKLLWTGSLSTLQTGVDILPTSASQDIRIKLNDPSITRFTVTPSLKGAALASTRLIRYNTANTNPIFFADLSVFDRLALAVANDIKNYDTGTTVTLTGCSRY